MTQEELNYIKDAFSQIIDDIAGNPDWYEAARAVASDLGTLERELGKKVASPPSNLDEAAFSYENDLWESGFKECGYSPQEVSDAFKAGAEWIAGQGFSFSGEVNDNEFVDTDKGILHSKEMPFKNGDKVIVQIRKVNEKEK